MSLPAIRGVTAIRFEDHQSSYEKQQRIALDEMLARDPESWCRLQGLFAMLRLPATEEQRQTIQIERRPGEWMAIDSVEIRGGMIRYTKGHNGHSDTQVMPLSEPVLPWRIGPRELAPRYV